MKEFIITNWFQIVTVVGIIITWITERYLRKANIKKAGADALSGMQDSYNKYVEDFNKKYDALLKDVDYLREELRVSLEKNLNYEKVIETLNIELKDAKSERTKLQSQMKSFEREKQKDKIEISNLRKELDKIKLITKQ